MKVLTCFFALLILSQIAVSQWVKQKVDTTASLRGLSVVDEKVVWASGSGGTVIRTVDGGKAWLVMTVPGAEKLDFRDIEAFDANTAYVLSIGDGVNSRIYKTMDGGKNWKMQFQNENPKAFFDAIACWDRSNCIAMSDPVDGHYVLISTADGANWKRIVSNQMPAAKDGEAAFAASGTCLITQGKTNAFLVSGGTDARVFRSNDRGLTWAVADTPMIKGTSGSGIFSIAMYDETNGVIVGGNYEKPDEGSSALATTSDGGRTWRAGHRLGGYRSAVAYITANMLFAVGTNGSDFSLNGGAKWNSIDGGNYNSVAARGKSAIWAVGPNGYVTKFDRITSDTFKLKFP